MALTFMELFLLILCIIALVKIYKIERQLKPTVADLFVEFFTSINGQNEKVVYMFLKGNQALPLSIAIKDKFGNVARVDGTPTWAVTDASLGSIVSSDDGMSATFTPTGAVGALKIQVSADADLGEGVKSILGELDVEITAGEAVTVEIAAGSPVDLP